MMTFLKFREIASFFARVRRVLSHNSSCPRREKRLKSRKISLVRRVQHAEAAACCPITSQQFGEPQAVPRHRPHQTKQPREAVVPVAEKSQESQHHVEQQRHPDLPLDRVFAVAEEVAQLQRLLDLLEKRLDRPAAFVQVRDAAGRPFHIVRDECHLDPLAVNFHPRHKKIYAGIVPGAMRAGISRRVWNGSWGWPPPNQQEVTHEADRESTARH